MPDGGVPVDVVAALVELQELGEEWRDRHLVRVLARLLSPTSRTGDA